MRNAINIYRCKACNWYDISIILYKLWIIRSWVVGSVWILEMALPKMTSRDKLPWRDRKIRKLIVDDALSFNNGR